MIRAPFTSEAPATAPGGGEGTSPLRVVVLDSVVDITNNDEFVDVLSASVEANSVYHVEGYCRAFTAVDADLILSLPSGATFTGSYESFAGGFSAATYWDGTRLTGQSYGDGATLRFAGVVDTAGTAGNFKLRACQTVADPATTEIPVGTYITITKAQ